MDVTCPRCQTDYEFDDALVSERGTTVKCTNCGHQFRVFRPRASAAAVATPELWKIERRGGEPLELRSLVELQRAIRAGRVSRTDQLRRGDGPSRRVGDIPELEPFFPAPRAEGAPNTLPLPSIPGSVAEPLMPPPRAPAHTPAYGGRAVSAPPPRAPGPPPRVASERPLPPPPRLPTPAFGLPPPPETSGARTPPPRAAQNDAHEPEPPTIRRSDANRSSSRGAVPSGPPRTEGDGALARETTSVPPRGESYDSLFPAPPPARRGGAVLLVAVLLIGSVVLLGATIGRPYVNRLLAGGAPQASASVSNDRLARELAAGDRARTDGDWAGAREAFVRATTIDETSLPAWDGLCTAESELALAHWIAALAGHSALERQQAAAIGDSAGKSCTRWAELTRATPEGAKKVSSDLRVVRALAAQGDGGGVRVYLPVHSGNAVVEALAYLADATKGDVAVVQAATKQAAAALAKADVKAQTTGADLALIAFGAASQGNATRRDEALAELAKRAPRHMLLDMLRSIGATGADAGPLTLTPPDAGVDAKPAAVVAVGGGGGAVAPAGGGDEPVGGDYRALNEKGHKALAAGEASKAESFFRAALAQHPNDVDALYGLGQIARSRGDHGQAISYFKQVLDVSSGFAPARLALADEQWSIGEQAAAIKNYELYLDRVSEGSGADRARSRIGKPGGAVAPKPDEAPAPKKPDEPKKDDE